MRKIFLLLMTTGSLFFTSWSLNIFFPSDYGSYWVMPNAEYVEKIDIPDSLPMNQADNPTARRLLSLPDNKYLAVSALHEYGILDIIGTTCYTVSLYDAASNILNANKFRIKLEGREDLLNYMLVKNELRLYTYKAHRIGTQKYVTIVERKIDISSNNYKLVATNIIFTTQNKENFRSGSYIEGNDGILLTPVANDRRLDEKIDVDDILAVPKLFFSPDLTKFAITFCIETDYECRMINIVTDISTENVNIYIELFGKNNEQTFWMTSGSKVQMDNKGGCYHFYFNKESDNQDIELRRFMNGKIIKTTYKKIGIDDDDNTISWYLHRRNTDEQEFIYYVADDDKLISINRLIMDDKNLNVISQSTILLDDKFYENKNIDEFKANIFGSPVYRSNGDIILLAEKFTLKSENATTSAYNPKNIIFHYYMALRDYTILSLNKNFEISWVASDNERDINSFYLGDISAAKFLPDTSNITLLIPHDVPEPGIYQISLDPLNGKTIKKTHIITFRGYKNNCVVVPNYIYNYGGKYMYIAGRDNTKNNIRFCEHK